MRKQSRFNDILDPLAEHLWGHFDLYPYGVIEIATSVVIQHMFLIVLYVANTILVLQGSKMTTIEPFRSSAL